MALLGGIHRVDVEAIDTNAEELHMQNILIASPQVRASDFVQIAFQDNTLQDLLNMEQDGLQVLAGLNDYLTLPRSVNATLQARRLIAKVMQQMAHLRSHIYAQKAAEGLRHAVASGHADHPSLVPMEHGGAFMPRGMGRKSRVIRQPMGADNAASGPLEIPGIKPTAWDTDARRGGEAKEAGALRQSGEAGR